MLHNSLDSPFSPYPPINLRSAVAVGQQAICARRGWLSHAPSRVSILERLAVRILSAATEFPKISNFRCLQDLLKWPPGPPLQGSPLQAALAGGSTSLCPHCHSVPAHSGINQSWAATAACNQGKAKAGTGDCEAQDGLCLAYLGAGNPRGMVTLAPPE